MKITVNYTLSEEGQKEALRHGMPAATKDQTIEFEATASLLDRPYVTVSPEGKAEINGRFDTTPLNEKQAALNSLYNCSAPMHSLKLVIEQCEKGIKEWKQQQQKKQEEKEKEHQESLRRLKTALAIGTISYGTAGEFRYSVEQNGETKEGYGAFSSFPEIRAELEAKALETRQKITAQRMAEETRARTEESKKRMQLTEIVEQYGTELQRGRWRAGMMAVAEAIGLLAKQQFKVLEGFIQADNEYFLDEDVLKHAEDCERDDELIACTCEDKKTLTDEQYANLLKLKKLLPADAEYRLRIEILRCKECEAKLSLVYVSCHWTVGVIELHRDVAL